MGSYAHSDQVNAHCETTTGFVRHFANIGTADSSFPRSLGEREKASGFWLAGGSRGGASNT
jgi:hypothetical protein